MLFDAYLIVDWSARREPNKQGQHMDRFLKNEISVENVSTDAPRAKVYQYLRRVSVRRVLGFDFPSVITGLSRAGLLGDPWSYLART
jgi:hypothetical protein